VLAVGNRQVAVFHKRDWHYRLEAAVALRELVWVRHWMGLLAAGRQLVELPQVVGFVTSSRLILRLQEEAEYQVVLERQAADSPLVVELRLAMLKQGRALAFEHTRLAVHQLDHTEPVAQSHRLAAAEPLPRCKLAASGFDTQREKAGVLRLTLLLRMRRRHDEL
jgi:hypothetical protein